MIYELRVYHAVPGRLPDLLKRFDTITLKIWERHGIRPIGWPDKRLVQQVRRDDALSVALDHHLL